MNKIERIKCVKAMELMARQINDEGVFETWLMYGVADGDIAAGDLNVKSDDEELMGYYIEDEHFADLMDTFTYIIARARNRGGLYCDGVVSKRGAS